MTDEQFITLLATHLDALDQIIGMTQERLWADDAVPQEPYKYATPEECIDGARQRLTKVRTVLAATPESP